MSFKREGDDKSQLNILKKRRVADLLSHFIPEDEAALMKNGRYTCLVCSYRPVFDTVDTLSVHRGGKRHLEGLKYFYGKKARLRNEKTKRQHRSYVEAEDARREPSSSAPLLAQTRKITHHALLKTSPYNSCHRKTSTKCENGPARTGSHQSGSTCDETAPASRKSEVSRNLAASDSNDSEAADEESSKDTTAATEEADVMSAQRRRELEHHLKLKSDGWVRDRSGRWVKDDNAEFDSDDDEPASLAPPPAGRSED
ncbi:sodium channel modifier 1 [Brachyistius frenatus]|uniref:sodium channel modifier 1 n=1 Tax=Brachyistius frenatus TaxID=100188 RepID=UPI0037E86A03